MKKHTIIYSLSIFFLTVSLLAQGQVTKIRGSVIDAEQRQPIPFAGIYFENTTVGVTADMDGKFTLETRDKTLSLLTAQILGYKPCVREIKPGVYNEVTFVLELADNRISEVRVKADNRKAKKLLRNISEHRDRNDPSRRPRYSCDVYNKMEISLTHPREQLSNKLFGRHFGFIFDYIDTSAISGVPYLPIMISETVSKRRHSLNPAVDNEKIIANQISGINAETNILTQFTGSMMLNVNFYDNFVNAFGVEFPSPLLQSGMMFYNYYVVDSLDIDKRKTYIVHYHPKALVSTPVFDGEMHIDAQDYALRSIHAKMTNMGNVNWVRDLVIDANFRRLADSTWFFDSDNVYADFSLSLRDSSKMMSFIGKRELVYSNPEFDEKGKLSRSDGLVRIDEKQEQSREFWDKARPHELSAKERNVYKMVDEIQDVKLYKDLYTILYTAFNGYHDVGKIGFGPYFKIFSFNRHEGFRVQLGVRTTGELSMKRRYGGYLAYGFGDRTLKGGLHFERIFDNNPTRKITATASRDVFQLGRGRGEYTSGNIMSSIMGGAGSSRLCMRTELTARYDHEFSNALNAGFGMSLKRFSPTPYVPMFDFTGRGIESVASNEMYAFLRFSTDETVNRGPFIKKYIYTKHPVVTMSLTGSVPGLRRGDVGFVRPELSVKWKLRLPPLGTSFIDFNAGTVIGRVPYPYLHLFAGNSTYLLDKSAFSCMNYFEFAADKWTTLMWNHCFNGFFLGKIPGIRGLQMREELTVKLAYGTLSDKNNGVLPPGRNPAHDKFLFPPHGNNSLHGEPPFPPHGGNRIRENAPVSTYHGAYMASPQGMQSLNGVPYIELGAGISNIFRVFRIDCFWRLTHRDKLLPDGRHAPAQNFRANIGIELRF